MAGLRVCGTTCVCVDRFHFSVINQFSLREKLGGCVFADVSSFYEIGSYSSPN